MLPVNFGSDPAANLSAPCPAPKGGGATPAAAGSSSFHHLLRDASAASAEIPAKTAPGQGTDAVSGTGREAAVDDSSTRPQSGNAVDDAAGQPVWALLAQIIRKLTAAADQTAGAAGSQEAAVAPDPKAGPAADGSRVQPPSGNAVDDTAGQPIWALLAQIIQNLTAAAETTTGAVEDGGDAAADLAALVDFLKQLQESPAALTAESGIPLDRLQQTLDRWPADANASLPPGLSGRLLELLKSLQAAKPGLAGEQPAAAMASQDEVEKASGRETAAPADAAPVAPDGTQLDGLSAVAGRAARGVLRDVQGTRVGAGQSDTAVRSEEPSDRSRPAADERSPGAGRVLPAPSPAAGPPAEAVQSTAAPSKVQAAEGRFVVPRDYELQDAQSEVSDDSRSPAEKTMAGLALSTADGGAEEGGPAGLRFEAALRGVQDVALPEANPDKPAEAAAPARGRDTAAAPAKADLFDQIVQRAAVQVKNEQGEMRIDLKPEVLGHVRLQIVTDNQLVTVRILTELPIVRDLIENNIQQLKSDLQQQGLQVERIEVAVADDPRQHPGRQARAGAGRKGHADGDSAPVAADLSAGLRPEAAYRWGPGGPTTINMFA